eukprot:5757930-Prymnesium_polylepis.1
MSGSGRLSQHGATHKVTLHFFKLSAHNTCTAKGAKADVPHAHHGRGWRSPMVRPAPTHRPASCWRVWPATIAASRTARPPLKSSPSRRSCRSA